MQKRDNHRHRISEARFVPRPCSHMRATLVDFFRDLETRRGDFLVYDDGYRVHRHTYAQVTRAARGFAQRLSSAGIAPGDKVIFWGENRPEWIVCFWGCLIAGVVAVPID